jgi:hypothetical protein
MPFAEAAGAPAGCMGSNVVKPPRSSPAHFRRRPSDPLEAVNRHQVRATPRNACTASATPAGTRKGLPMQPSDFDNTGQSPAAPAPVQKPSFGKAMWRIRNAKPIVPDRSASIGDDLFAKYQALFADAGIPLERGDVQRYSALLQTHGPGGLASNPALYATESIGVAALADMHHAPGARRIADMDQDTLENEMDERTMARSGQQIDPPEPSPTQTPATLLRVSRNNAPEESKNADFAQVGKIVGVDDSYVTQQTADARFRYRTADIAAATDIAQIKAARDSGDPVNIERRDGRVTIGVVKQQQLDHAVPPPSKHVPKEPEARVWMTNWPGKRTNDSAVEMKDGLPLDGQPQRPIVTRSKAVAVEAPKKPIVLPPAPKPRLNYEATKDSRQRHQQPSDVVFETPVNTAVNERTTIDLSKTKEPTEVTGRFITKTRQGKSEKALGLALNDENNQIVHLSAKHTAALLKDKRVNALVEENLQNGSQATPVKLRFENRKWSVNPAPPPVNKRT